MNSADIRLTLEKEKIKVSSVRIGRVAVSLGFGDNLNYNYTDDEGTQILDAIRADYAAQAQAKTPQQETPQTIGSMPTDDSRALTKQAIASSSDALTGQVKALAVRMDESDRSLARQLAGYVAERPQRFTMLFAQELAALTAPIQQATFVDVELAAVEMPDLRGDFMSIAASSALGCLPM